MANLLGQKSGLHSHAEIEIAFYDEISTDFNWESHCVLKREDFTRKQYTYTSRFSFTAAMHVINKLTPELLCNKIKSIPIPEFAMSVAD